MIFQHCVQTTRVWRDSPNVLLLNRNQNMVDFTLLVLLAGRGHLCGYNASFASHHIHFSHLGNLIEQFLHMTLAELMYAFQISKLMEIEKISFQHFYPHFSLHVGRKTTLGKTTLITEKAPPSGIQGHLCKKMKNTRENKLLVFTSENKEDFYTQKRFLL